MKYILGRSELILLETISKFKKYAVDNKIEYDENIVKEVGDIFKKNPNYVEPILKIMVRDNSLTSSNEIEDLRNLAPFIINKSFSNQLPKKISDYASIEELGDDIYKQKGMVSLNKFLNSLYPEYKEALRHQIENDSIMHPILINISIEWFKMSDEIRALMTPLKYYHVNGISVNKFLEDVKNFIEEMGTPLIDQVKGHLKKWKNRVEVAYNDERIGVLVVRVLDNNQELFCDFGAAKRCIVYSKINFQDYTKGDNNTQYFVYKYKLPISDPTRIVGITVNIDGIIPRAAFQDALNGIIPDREGYFKSLGIDVPEVVFYNNKLKTINDTIIRNTKDMDIVDKLIYVNDNISGNDNIDRLFNGLIAEINEYAQKNGYINIPKHKIEQISHQNVLNLHAQYIICGFATNNCDYESSVLLDMMNIMKSKSTIIIGEIFKFLEFELTPEAINNIHSNIGDSLYNIIDKNSIYQYIDKLFMVIFNKRGIIPSVYNSFEKLVFGDVKLTINEKVGLYTRYNDIELHGLGIYISPRILVIGLISIITKDREMLGSDDMVSLFTLYQSFSELDKNRKGNKEKVVSYVSSLIEVLTGIKYDNIIELIDENVKALINKEDIIRHIIINKEILSISITNNFSEILVIKQEDLGKKMLIIEDDKVEDIEEYTYTIEELAPILAGLGVDASEVEIMVDIDRVEYLFESFDISSEHEFYINFNQNKPKIKNLTDEVIKLLGIYAVPYISKNQLCSIISENENAKNKAKLVKLDIEGEEPNTWYIRTEEFNDIFTIGFKDADNFDEDRISYDAGDYLETSEYTGYVNDFSKLILARRLTSDGYLNISEEFFTERISLKDNFKFSTDEELNIEAIIDLVLSEDDDIPETLTTYITDEYDIQDLIDIFENELEDIFKDAYRHAYEHCYHSEIISILFRELYKNDIIFNKFNDGRYYKYEEGYIYTIDINALFDLDDSDDFYNMLEYDRRNISYSIEGLIKIKANDLPTDDVNPYIKDSDFNECLIEEL